MIIGCFGFQRSGKTAIAMYIARELQKKYNCEIYTNIDAKNVNIIDNINEIPFSGNSKVLVFDEAYFYLDSRNFKNNKDFSIFLNTLGKQNILLIVTAPTLDMIEKRIRRQLSYIFIAKADKKYMYYKIYDVLRDTLSKTYNLEKNDELWKYLDYNSYLVIPNFIECNINDYVKKYREYMYEEVRMV